MFLNIGCRFLKAGLLTGALVGAVFVVAEPAATAAATMGTAERDGAELPERRSSIPTTPPGSQDCLVRARALLEAGDPDGARAAIERHCGEELASGGDGQALLGRIAAARRRWEEARKHWAAAAEATPPIRGAALWVGWVEMRAERLLEALGWLARAAEETPTDARPWYYSALCRVALDDPAAARDALLAALDRDPSLAAAWRLLASVERMLARPQAALGAARQAVRVAPDRADAHRLLGELALEAGRLREAARHFADALDRRPDDLAAATALAGAYFAAWPEPGLPDPAAPLCRALREAVRERFRQPLLTAETAALLRGLTRLALGDPDAAARLVDPLPDTSGELLRAFRALVLQLRNDPRARDAAEQAHRLALDPDIRAALGAVFPGLSAAAPRPE